MTVNINWSYGHIITKAGWAMPRAFTDQEKRQITERLLEAGRKQFTTYGLKKTNVEELAAAAGISKGAFYLFYESKEALLMDLLEQAEVQYRQEIMSAIEAQGGSARERLYRVLHTAFTLWRNFPILQLFARADYALLSRQLSAGKMQEHVMSDQQFVGDLILRCRAAGMPIVATADQLSGLFYVVVFATLHEDDFGEGRLRSTLDLLLQLITAFCLGEIALMPHDATALLRGLPNEVHDGSNDSGN